MSQKTAGSVIDSPHGLFIITDDGIFKFNSTSNCFEEIEVKNKDGGAAVRTFTGITKDPK